MISLNKFRPVSKLRVPENLITKPKFPVIDAHNHLSLSMKITTTPTEEELFANMEEFNIRMIVNLDGNVGPEGERQLELSEKISG